MSTALHQLAYLVEGQSQKEASINNSLDRIDKGLSGNLTKSVGGGSNVTLTTTEWNNRTFEFTGTLTANISVIVPTGSTRLFAVYNNTSGAFTLTVRTSSGTGVVVNQGFRTLLWNDATDVRQVVSAPTASETQAGMTETATEAEVDVGTDTFRYVTPFTLAQRGVRVVTQASSTTVSPNGETTDIHHMTCTEPSGTLTIAAPSGTPKDGQKMQIRLKLVNTQGINFASIYRFSTDVPPPTSLVGGKTHYMLIQYNSVDSKWDYLSEVKGF